MKTLTLLALMISFSVHAVVIEFYGPCSSRPIFSGELAPKFETVGDLTIHFLETNRIPYQGNEQGLNSVGRSPVGMEALEVISDVEMRSYGWCFYVDGVAPEVFANEVLVKDVKKLQWIFGYAHFLKGVWSGQCSRAYEIKPAFLCQK